MPAFQRARDEAERAVANSPESDFFKRYLADGLWNLGEQYVDLGRVDDGLPLYRRAVTIAGASSRPTPVIASGPLS